MTTERFNLILSSGNRVRVRDALDTEDFRQETLEGSQSHEDYLSPTQYKMLSAELGRLNRLEKLVNRSHDLRRSSLFQWLGWVTEKEKRHEK